MRWLERVSPRSIVEVGAGMGAMAYRLADRFDYRGYEPDPISFQVAEGHLRRLGRGDMINTEIPAEPDQRFDVLAAFEVLEHLEDDFQALRHWSRWLKPGGHVMMSMPSQPDRFGPWDARVGHFRRYSRNTLARVLGTAGFDVVAIESWGMPVGYMLETGRNLVARRRLGETGVGTAGSGRVLQPPAWLGRAVELAMKPVAALQSPFCDTDRGIGYVVVGRLQDEPGSS